ncbi:MULTISPECIES: ExbD/TolR family protein [unclassified Flavobacterium]|uniref:ExbD/TolR family protein n=1 Tax=unclassified Flavobacterium TaxID=196869 RepID=UPI00057D1932|nr:MULTISPECIES: biopolymer transporter ExbD [unclassified Flavobacterium]KIA96814.1 biopolymer transporter ExbD [Flavobacterium sp. KMS]MEA9412250.1 biopolymer transporter ExbD [Flavobacterium sp. PL02]
MEIYKKDKKVRSKKLKARVDLTAMVSVSFLLIVFFMVTTELGKPKNFDFGLPDKEQGCGPIACYDSNRFYTILLGDNDKIVTYSGLLSYPIEAPKEIKYGKNGIRKEISNRNRTILQYSASMGKPKNGAIIVIKPGNKSNYGNLVNILDEMKIAGIETYAIQNEFTPEESKLLAAR